MKRLLWLTVSLLGAGCTLLTHFDPEGQPCDTTAPRAMQCLTGYACGPDQRCTKGTIADAGDAPLDAGGAASDAGAEPIDAGNAVIDAGTPDAGSGPDGG